MHTLPTLHSTAEILFIFEKSRAILKISVPSEFFVLSIRICADVASVDHLLPQFQASNTEKA